MSTQHSKRSIAFIFARGGSKAVPGKNIKLLAGKPLIAYSIEIARACSMVEAVIVSTDNGNIAQIARDYGAEVPFLRPLELATDNSPEWLAWQHAIRWFRMERGDFDTFISLPTTSPFRKVEDINACINVLHANPATDVVITVRSAERNPYFNMVKLDENGYAHLMVEPNNAVVRRQDVPTVFDITTVAYVARPLFVLTANRLFDGKIRTVQIPSERGMDIDTQHDFMIAELMMQSKFMTKI